MFPSPLIPPLYHLTLLSDGFDWRILPAPLVILPLTPLPLSSLPSLPSPLIPSPLLPSPPRPPPPTPCTHSLSPAASGVEPPVVYTPRRWF